MKKASGKVHSSSDGPELTDLGATSPNSEESSDRQPVYRAKFSMGEEGNGSKSPAKATSSPEPEPEDELEGLQQNYLNAQKVVCCCNDDMTIDPLQSKWAKHWDTVIAVTLIYTAVVTPYEIAFLPDTAVNALFVFNQLVNFIFAIDVVLQFFLHFQLPKSKVGRVGVGRKCSGLAHSRPRSPGIRLGTQPTANCPSLLERVLHARFGLNASLRSAVDILSFSQ